MTMIEEYEEKNAEKKTLTRAGLYDAVYRRLGISRAESSALVELIFSEIIRILSKGETVKLSAFGSFVVRHKRARLGRNPKTKKEAEIAARRVLLFKPSHVLRGRLNGLFVNEEMEPE